MAVAQTVARVLCIKEILINLSVNRFLMVGWLSLIALAPLLLYQRPPLLHSVQCSHLVRYLLASSAVTKHSSYSVGPSAIV